MAATEPCCGRNGREGAPGGVADGRDMIRIGGPTRSVGPAQSGGPRRSDAAGSTFQPGSSEPAARATTSGPVATLAGLDALMALQAIDGDEPRKRRRAVKRGHDLLDVLEEIKLGLLSGSLSGSALDRAVMLLSSMEPTGDEGLDGLVADIALRAEVELAKLGRYRDGEG